MSPTTTDWDNIRGTKRFDAQPVENATSAAQARQVT
jgi:hypothetical protein